MIDSVKTCEPLAAGVPAAMIDGEDVSRYAIVGVPSGVTGWKVRHGPDRFSTIFLRYADGIDERALVYGVAPRTLTPAADLLLRSTRRGVPAVQEDSLHD